MQQTGTTISATRHEEYYIPGGDLYFLAAGTTHFRVHSYFFFRESGYWRDRMAGPISPGDNRRPAGSHESTAFLVEEDPEDFALFLWIFYNKQYDTYNTSLDNWITILRLAAQWDCPNVREFALSYIDKMPMEIVARIKIYKDYNAPYSYLLPLYMKLAIRERVLEREEFRVLDGDTLYSIVRAREMLRAPVPAGVYNSMISPLRAELSDDEKFDIVVAAFDIPPEEVEALRVSVVPFTANDTQQ